MADRQLTSKRTSDGPIEYLFVSEKDTRSTIIRGRYRGVMWVRDEHIY